MVVTPRHLGHDQRVRNRWTSLRRVVSAAAVTVSAVRSVKIEQRSVEGDQTSSPA
jgi:hypothetical protein